MNISKLDVTTNKKYKCGSLDFLTLAIPAGPTLAVPSAQGAGATLQTRKDSATPDNRQNAEHSTDQREAMVTRGDDWKIVQFLEGIESAAEAPADIIAWLLSDARPPATFSNDFEWCQHLARNPAELSTILGQKQLVDKLAQGLSNQMAALLEQTAATAAEQNDKFLANVDALLEYGRRDVFDGGLANWIGVPNKTDPMMEMYREHNDYDYSSKEFYVWNYGTTTSPKTEWIGAAGVWAPGNKSHALKPGFELPRETKNIEPETHHQPRRVVCLNLFLHTPTADEARQWQLECKEDVDRLSPLDRSRRLVYKAGLQPARSWPSDCGLDPCIPLTMPCYAVAQGTNSPPPCMSWFRR